MRTCGGGGRGSHADHLAWLVHYDIRVVEHRRRALLAVDRGGGGGCARQWGVARGGDWRPCGGGSTQAIKTPEQCSIL